MTVTAALVLIGNEVIRGIFTDENSPYLRDELTSVGVQVSSIHIVRDDVNPVAALVRLLASEVTYVVTVGGLGPTLDDVTMEAVALAFDMALLSQEPADAADYSRMSGSETVQAALRHRPERSEIIRTDHGPIVQTRNVFSLPGLPRLVKARFPALLGHLARGKIVMRSLAVETPQSVVAEAVAEAGQRFPDVSIGIYPAEDISEGTLMTLEGSEESVVDACMDFLLEALPSAQVRPDDRVPGSG
jgi:molybdenum cofactor synthesis domain-containing protein